MTWLSEIPVVAVSIGPQIWPSQYPPAATIDESVGVILRSMPGYERVIRALYFHVEWTNDPKYVKLVFPNGIRDARAFVDEWTQRPPPYHSHFQLRYV